MKAETGLNSSRDAIASEMQQPYSSEHYYFAVEKLTLLVATYGKPLLVAIFYHIVSDSLGSRLATLVTCLCVLVAFFGFRVWLILHSNSSKVEGAIETKLEPARLPPAAAAAVPAENLLGGSGEGLAASLLLDTKLQPQLKKRSKIARRSLQLSESFVTLVDLITNKKKRKKIFRLFPAGYETKHISRLSTAPVEDSEQDEKSPENDEPMDSDDSSPQIAAKLSSSSSNLGSSDDDDEAEDSNNSNRSGVNDGDGGGEQHKAEDKDRPLPIIRRKRTNSATNINPCAAYGVAAERMRIKMNAKSERKNLPPRNKQERRRFWRSLYAHAGIPTSVDQGGETYPLCPPLILATTFNIRSSGAWSDDDYFYSRISNPTRKALEETLASAEQGYNIEEDDDMEGDSQKCQAACFGSGMVRAGATRKKKQPHH
jgi:hypothetical protein